MAKLILGVTGEIGCGKGAIAEHIKREYGGSVYRFSNILRDVLDRIHLDQSRVNMQTLSTIFRKNFGEDILAKAVYHDTYNDEHDIVLVDGVRRMVDISFLRELPNFKLIYIDADMELRYKRIAKRSENPDDSGKTFEEFQKDESGEAELQIRDLKNYADNIIDNSGTFQELYKQVDEIIKKYITK
jgi:dephospho-CoA kinase